MVEIELTGELGREIKAKYCLEKLTVKDIVIFLISKGFKTDKNLNDTTLFDLYNDEGYVQSAYVKNDGIVLLIY